MEGDFTYFQKFTNLLWKNIVHSLIDSDTIYTLQTTTSLLEDLKFVMVMLI